MPDISTVTIKKNGQEATYNVKDAKARSDLDDKVPKEQGKGLSTNDYTTEEKNKLNGIEEQANKTVVDSELSDSSTNPVQNKVAKQAIDDKADAIISSASGSIAHFEDGAEANAKSVIAHIEPVQDLHGYDSPWPAGGGKNLLNIPDDVQTVNGVTATAKDGIVTLSGTASSRAVIYLVRNIAIPAGSYKFNGSQSALPASCYLNFRSGTGISVSESGSNLDLTLTLDTDTSGDNNSYVRIDIAAGTNTNNLVFKPMVRLATIADATFEPYSNICPITGHTEMNLVRTGENTCEEIFEDGYITASGALSAYANAIRSKNFNRCMPMAKYYYKITTGISGVNIAWYDKTKEFIMRSDNVGNSVITAPSNAYFYKLSVYKYKSANPSYANDISINYPSSDTEYHPYNGETYPIAFPSEAGTVYGGYVDVTNGKLVVDRAFMLLNNPERWTASASLAATIDFRYDTDVVDRKIFNNSFDGLKCSYAVVNKNNANNTARWSDVSSNTFGFKGLSLTLDQIKSDAEQGKISIVYELATPITYDLTPQQIETLLGVNNVWNDCNGNTDVEYKADTKLYIEQLTKPTEDDMTANANIASGKFFMIGNRLFISTAAIAQGATIVPGTNCTELSISEALNQVNA